MATKFEMVGVNFQYSSFTTEMARDRFARSCEICYLSGKHIECDRCAIAEANKSITEILNMSGGKKYGRVEERA